MSLPIPQRKKTLPTRKPAKDPLANPGMVEIQINRDFDTEDEAINYVASQMKSSLIRKMWRVEVIRCTVLVPLGSDAARTGKKI